MKTLFLIKGCTGRSARAGSGIAAFGVFFQKVVEQFLPVMKSRTLEPGEHLGEIKKPSLRRTREQAQRSGDLKSISQRCRRSFAIVNENEIGSESRSQRKGCALPGVQGLQRRIVARYLRQDL